MSSSIRLEFQIESNPWQRLHIAYDSEDEAIRIANDSKYGLHAAVLGTDLPRARRVASQIRAARVAINGMTDDPQAPWEGSNTPASAANTADTGRRHFLNPAPF
jgi:aldehyde dehydrogenase (NAD+)